MCMADRIKEKRIQAGLTQEELAEKLGLKKSAIAKYENGRVENIKRSIIQKMSDILDCTPSYLMGWDENVTIQTVQRSHYRIPVLTTVAAGKPIYAEEDVLQWIDYDKEPGDHVRACRIEGNSMIPRIQNGDTVIFDSELGWEDGDVVIATVNGDHATCKRIKRYADGIALLSDNANIAPMYFSKKEVEELPVKVIGRVTEVRGKL